MSAGRPELGVARVEEAILRRLAAGRIHGVGQDNSVEVGRTWGPLSPRFRWRVETEQSQRQAGCARKQRSGGRRTRAPDADVLSSPSIFYSDSCSCARDVSLFLWLRSSLFRADVVDFQNKILKNHDFRR